MVYEIYSAVRTSPDWDKILLVILFDEHGGSADHVPPPTKKECAFAISPDGLVIAPDKPGGTGFEFDSLGCASARHCYFGIHFTRSSSEPEFSTTRGS